MDYWIHSRKHESLNSKEEIILDVGPETIKKIEGIIDQSNTVLWNGPAGYFENKNFLLLDNKPLCQYIFDTLNKVDRIDEIYVYCSNSKIMNCIPMIPQSIVVIFERTFYRFYSLTKDIVFISNIRGMNDTLLKQ